MKIPNQLVPFISLYDQSFLHAELKAGWFHSEPGLNVWVTAIGANTATVWVW